MSETEKLRKHLDELGIEHTDRHRHYKGYAYPDNDYTTWKTSYGSHGVSVFHENSKMTTLKVEAYGITAKQAVQATLVDDKGEVIS